MNTMHLQHSVAIRPNLELKTRPKQLLGSLPLVIALPRLARKKLFRDQQPKLILSRRRRLGQRKFANIDT